MFPTDDIETRGAWLFRHLLTLYGSRFLAMWRGVDTDDLKRAWSLRLHGLSPESLRAGLRALDGLQHPPTLPEFLGLCREARVQQFANSAPRLGSSLPPCTPGVAEDNLRRMRAIADSVKSCKPSPEWAFDVLDRIAARPVKAPPDGAGRIALDVIASPAGRAFIANATDEKRGRWRAALETLGGNTAELVASRVPGCDDEPATVGDEHHDPV